MNSNSSNIGRLAYELIDSPILADGTYTVIVPLGTSGPAPDFTGLGGITFDSITVLEPSSTSPLGLVGLALVLCRRK